ncbi:MAG TPA: DNA polymerase III subunit delta' [Desulfobacterales bacterium]|nr:DNA polymerase III subunit delta' [Desulfobacterales bacterium]HIP40556.1 DNA polymerase III subunit delta' [Desulfocapsa sulfexigens]
MPTAELQIAGKPFYGQHQSKMLLAGSLASDRLAHAYLFRGPEGVGKQLFARGLAAAVNCKDSHGLSACGVCSSCVKLAAESHPDFLIVSPDKGAIKINQIRSLIKTLSFDPYEAKTRVVLIEDVHTMRQEAANSLLKTLEEPPENNLLILTANSAGNVLQTIISRCQTIPFYSLTSEETAEILRREDGEMDSETALLLARLSEGSPGKAMLYHHLGLVDFWKELVVLLTDKGSNGDKEVGRLLLMAESMAGLKEDLPHLLGLIRLWIRDCLLDFYGQRIDAEMLNIRKDWNSEQYFAKLQAIDQAEKELSRNCNRTLVCEVLLFQLNS